MYYFKALIVKFKSWFTRPKTKVQKPEGDYSSRRKFISNITFGAIGAVSAASALASTKVNDAGITFGDGSVQASAVNSSTLLSKSGGTMTGTILDFTSTGIDDNSSATAVTINADGKVGINNPNPLHQLSVTGDIYASGSLYQAGNAVATTSVVTATDAAGTTTNATVNFSVDANNVLTITTT